MTDDLTPEIPAEEVAGAGIREYLRAIEAVVLVAHDPVPPDVLAQLLERPTHDIEEWCELLAAEYRRDDRGFELVKVAGGYRFQTHSDLVAYVERFLLHDRAPACRVRRWRRWRSSPTSSRSRGPRSRRSGASTPTA